MDQTEHEKTATPADEAMAVVWATLSDFMAQIAEALKGVEAAVAAPPVVVEEPPPDQEPPPVVDEVGGGGPKPVAPAHMQAEAEEGQLTLTWENPPGSELLPLFLSWGRDRQEGKTTLPVGSATFRLDSLPGGTWTVDYGYVNRGGVPHLDRLQADVAQGAATTTPPPESGPPPNSKAALRDAVKANAGCKRKDLKHPSALQGLPVTWVERDNILQVHQPCTLSGLRVPGLVYWAGRGGPLVIEDSVFEGLQRNASAGPVKARRCTCVRNTRLALGQGGLHGLSVGFEVVDCDISGFADGIQGSGPGLVQGCWFHDFAFGTVPSGGSTHNDGIQNYSGPVTVKKTVFEMAGRRNMTNGALFSSNNTSASFDAEDCWFEVLGGEREANVLHANTSKIVARRCMVKGGRVIGNVQLIDSERVG